MIFRKSYETSLR